MLPRLHVVPAPGGGCAVKRPGASRASRWFTDRYEAIRWAIDRARDAVVHRADGTIGWAESWFDEDGNDTRTPEA